MKAKYIMQKDKYIEKIDQVSKKLDKKTMGRITAYAITVQKTLISLIT